MTVYNELPVLTFRWTKANSVSLEDVNTEFKEYRLNPIKRGEEFFKDSWEKEITLSEDFVGASKESLKEVMEGANFKKFLIAKENSNVDVYLDFSLDDANKTLLGDLSVYAFEGSTINLTLDFNGEEEEGYTNFLTRVYGEKNSTINITKVQRQSNKRHIEHRYTKLEENSQLNYLIVDLDGQESLYHYVSDLKGDDSKAEINCIYIGEGKSLTDLYNNIRFFGKRAIGNYQVRGALKDNAKKYFRGTLDFVKGCSGSEGDEEENVILLNDKVKSFAIPILLAGEDDVAGNHAASAGQVDPSILFYIMSRGFSEKEAKKMIVQGSFSSIIDMIANEELRDFIIKSLDEKLEMI
ncbi:SufD family Fe-S cluster assembly protein [Lagierella sp.]|uniref:SufD family Fe-S cluster assembly protein n=1 Tax=Lagierella sp. TaxID=2849657 RepID=UPI0026326844|nr:SufD family Fe-S cluster assembly protein [Lagierella sp.]